MKGPMLTMLAGLVIILVGLVLSATVVTQATSAGTATGIGSFAGASSISDLIPLIWNVVVLTAGVGLIGLGAFRSTR